MSSNLPEWLRKSFSGLVVSDLDGTLRGPGGEISSNVLSALENLEEKNILRVVATGRSLHSTKKILSEDFPIDMLIFSSGAGVLCWKTGDLLRKHSLEESQAAELSNFLRNWGDLSFMVHQEIPENHRFLFFEASNPTGDFLRRVELHREHAGILADSWPAKTRATQVIVILSETEAAIYNQLKDALPSYSVIRTTSPLDHTSIWVEIFPKHVSKSQTTQWLAEQMGLTAGAAMAIGNDYNDMDLLDWAGASFVVSGAPGVLKGRYPVVGSCESGGPAEAIELWLRERRVT